MLLKKNNFRIFCIFLFFAVLCVTARAPEAKVYIDIDAPGFQQFPIAVSNFQVRTVPSGPVSDPHPDIAEAVRYCLNLSGVFQILDKKNC